MTSCLLKAPHDYKARNLNYEAWVRGRGEGGGGGGGGGDLKPHLHDVMSFESS